MKGYPVGVVKILSTSPRVKIKVTAMIKPIVAFSATDHIIAFGNVAEASLISSAVVCNHTSGIGICSEEGGSPHICTEQSYPSKQLNGEERPIMADKPVLGQPPLLVKVRRTSYAFPRGARTHRGIMTAKRPVI
jgi:hypothetical protein